MFNIIEVNLTSITNLKGLITRFETYSPRMFIQFKNFNFI